MLSRTMGSCSSSISRAARAILVIIPFLSSDAQHRSAKQKPQISQDVKENRGIALQINVGGREEKPQQYNLSNEITIKLGSLQKWTFPTSFFEKDAKVPFPISLAGSPPLFMQLRSGSLYIDAEVKGASGELKARITDNRVTLYAKDWDVNFTDAAIEIVNGQQQPVFQIVRERPDLIFIYSRFQNQNAVFDTTPLERVFLYPAWKYPGQYAPTLDAQTIDLSALDDAVLIKRTNDYISVLRGLEASYRKEFDEIHSAIGKDHTLSHTDLHAAEDAKYTVAVKKSAIEERSIEVELTKRISARRGAANAMSRPTVVEEMIIVGPSSFEEFENYLEALLSQMQHGVSNPL